MAGSSSAEASVRFSDGNRAYAEEDFAKASELYSAALTADPAFGAAHAHRSACHFAAHRYADARADAALAATLAPADANAQYRLGRAAFALAEFGASHRAFAEAARLRPARADYRKWLRKATAELEEQGVTPPEHGVAVPAAAAAAPAPAPKARFRHEWYQTADAVVLTLFIKKVRCCSAACAPCCR